MFRRSEPRGGHCRKVVLTKPCDIVTGKEALEVEIPVLAQPVPELLAVVAVTGRHWTQHAQPIVGLCELVAVGLNHETIVAGQVLVFHGQFRRRLGFFLRSQP